MPVKKITDNSPLNNNKMLMDFYRGNTLKKTRITNNPNTKHHLYSFYLNKFKAQILIKKTTQKDQVTVKKFWALVTCFKTKKRLLKVKNTSINS